MAHVHSQLIGLEHTPLAVRRWLENAECYHQETLDLLLVPAGGGGDGGR